MANTYRHSGKHMPVVSASAALTSGALAYQEGEVGVVITSAASGASTQLDTMGVHVLAVPSSTVKGDALYADLSSESAGLTLARTGGSGKTFIGRAAGDRDSAGKGLVRLAGNIIPGQGELETLALAVPTAAVADVATANADATYGQPEADLINELKTKVNALLAALRTAGLVTP